MGQCLTQFLQGAAAQQRRQQQPIRLQGAAQLDQRAGQVVHGLQRIEAESEIAFARLVFQTVHGVEARHAPVCREGAQRLRDVITDPQPTLEPPRYRRKPVSHALGRRREQETVAGQLLGTFLCAKRGGEIEKRRHGC